MPGRGGREIIDIYIVVLNDRHIDTQVTPFASAEAAISDAKRQASDLCRYPEDYHEEPELCTESWIFSATYSCEGDHVHVVKTELRGMAEAAPARREG